MSAIQRWLDRFCYKHPRFGIPNLMLVIVVGNVLVWLMDQFSYGVSLSALLAFSPYYILHGQIWRIITFVFVPLDSNLFFLAVSLYFYYMIGSVLEREWGTAKFNVFYGLGILLNVVVGLARLLTRTDDIETMKRYAGQMNGQIERVMAVLSDEKKPVDLGAYASAQPRSTERRLTGLRVLLVEDGEMNAEIMIRLLTDAGAECDRAADGMQALRRFEAVEAGTYDVVLMDMQMPVMDGCEAARAIRRCGRAGAADIPIIAMTANAFEDVRERIFDAGMDGYLGKPVEPDKLACAVIAAVKTRKGD